MHSEPSAVRKDEHPLPAARSGSCCPPERHRAEAAAQPRTESFTAHQNHAARDTAEISTQPHYVDSAAH